MHQENKPMIESNTQKYIPNTSNYDLLIVLRKQTQFCTLHPISRFISYKVVSTGSCTLHSIPRFVSYKTLSIGFHTFTYLNKTKIPKNTH